MNYDPLIFGKNDSERIVSVEAIEGMLHVFRETPEGNVVDYFLPNKYWIVAESKLDKHFVKLKGDLYYKWGKQYQSKDKFMKERIYFKNYDIFSIYNSKEASMVNKGLTYFKGMQQKDVSILAFDIETTGLNRDNTSKVLLIANTFRKQGQTIRKMFAFDDYKSEAAMLGAWCAWVREVNPSIMCGHNIFVYDLPYLKHVADRYNIPLQLGRDGSDIRFDSFESRFRKDAAMFYHYNKCHIYGRELVDTMFLSVKYDIGRKYDSYGLKSIIKQENLEVANRVFYDAGNIRNTYQDPVEWAKIKQYAEHDGDDALALYDLMSPSFFYLCQAVPKPYQLLLESASGSQVNSVMIRAYLQQGHSLPKAEQSEEFEGAISFGNPGIYKNVFKVDVSSLYPSIMLQYNIHHPKKDPNQYFPKLVDAFTTRRLEHKKLAKETNDKYYDDLQNAEKIFINSAYGFLATKGLLFNYPEGAAQVTKMGREILQKSIDWATAKGFQIVNADTDSISFTNNGLPISKEERKVLLQDLNSQFPSKIRFEDDGYYSMICVMRAKNYILKTEDGKVKVKGSALKASTKEKALKEFINLIINEIATEQTGFRDIYERYVDEALKVSDINRWASRKTVTSKVLNGTRSNETKILDAIKDSEYVEGDRCYVYFAPDNTIKLAENFNGEYSKDTLLKKLFNTAKVFSDVLDVKELFPNYSLKKNKKLRGIVDG